MAAILLVALILFLGVDFFRFQRSSFRRLFHKLFGSILRKHEKLDFTGATFLIFSSLLCVVFFKDIIAFLAMSFLSLGDTLAALIGIMLGKRRFVNQNNTLEGSLACFTSILIYSIVFAGKLISPWVYVTGAVVATLAELWRFPLDDNIKIPLLSGIAMSLIP